MTGAPDKQESPSYTSYTLPSRGTTRHKNFNVVPAPPSPLNQRNRTEVDFNRLF